MIIIGTVRPGTAQANASNAACQIHDAARYRLLRRSRIIVLTYSTDPNCVSMKMPASASPMPVRSNRSGASKAYTTYAIIDVAITARRVGPQ